MYSNHSNNIKCVDSTIKYVGFKSIHYTINLDIISFSIVFNDFNFIFLLMDCWFKSIKRITDIVF